MTNQEICYAFVKGTANGKHNLSMSISHDGSRLYSYNTCIAQKTPKGQIILNNSKYSVTTSKHQSNLRRALSSTDTIPTTKYVPFNTYDLNKYV